MKKRWLITMLLVTLLSVALLLAGCQSKNGTDGESAKDVGTQEQKEVEEEKAETEKKEETEEISLKFLHNSDSFDPETD